ncbi:MAG: hypothetical protein V1896_02995 [Candidatus Zambryskibacteria bacterium]
MFSIKESLKYGWNKAKEHVELILFTTLLLLAVGFFTKASLLGLIITIFIIIVRIGYTKIFLRIYDGETPKFVDIFQEYKIFWRYLGTSVLTCLVVVGGFILLIIPGIYWAIRFSFSPIIVVDTKMGPVVSMKESYAITKGQFWKIFGFWIIVGLLNLLGFIFLGIGLLVTVPVSTLASIYVYRKLSEAKAGLMQTTSPQIA